MKKILTALLFFPLVGSDLSELNKRSFDEMAGEVDVSDILGHVGLLDPFDENIFNQVSFNDLLETGDKDTAGPADADCWIDSINRQPLDLGVTHTASKKQRQKSKKSCSECGRNVFDLKEHMRTHTGEKPYKCEYPGCDYASICNNGLQRHIRTHTGEKPYKCKHPGCNYAAVQLSHIKRHERTHTGEKSYKRHERTHTGEMPYKCEYSGCVYVTSYGHHLNRHMKTHTGEMPFKCDHSGCVYEASRKDNLESHMKTHNKILCKICNKMIGDLAAHSRTQEHQINAAIIAVATHQENEE